MSLQRLYPSFKRGKSALQWADVAHQFPYVMIVICGTNLETIDFHKNFLDLHLQNECHLLWIFNLSKILVEASLLHDIFVALIDVFLVNVLQIFKLVILLQLVFIVDIFIH